MRYVEETPRLRSTSTEIQSFPVHRDDVPARQQVMEAEDHRAAERLCSPVPTRCPFDAHDGSVGLARVAPESHN